MKKNRWMIWIWLLFILIVLISIVLYVVYANKYHPYVGGGKEINNILEYLGGLLCI